MYTAHELYGVVDSLIPSCSGQVDEVLCSTALNQKELSQFRLQSMFILN